MNTITKTIALLFLSYFLRIWLHMRKERKCPVFKRLFDVKTIFVSELQKNQPEPNNFCIQANQEEEMQRKISRRIRNESNIKECIAIVLCCNQMLLLLVMMTVNLFHVSHDWDCDFSRRKRKFLL